MTTLTQILKLTKNPTLRESEDFAYLREQGLKYIEQLGSRLWTDYNLHDPGVTILEMLCYAITDLGYRTSHDIRHLLALNLDETVSPNDLDYFHTAKEILTVNPVTIDDYRRLLVDIDGIDNAWLIPTTDAEVRIFANLTKQKLTYIEAGNPEVLLNGLYDVLLRFEEDDELGDVNENWLQVTEEHEGEDLDLEIVFPLWSDLMEDPAQDTEKIKLFLSEGSLIVALDVVPTSFNYNVDLNGYTFPLTITFEYVPQAPVATPLFECLKDQDYDGDEVPPPPFVLPNPLPQETITVDMLVRFDGFTIGEVKGTIVDYLEKLNNNDFAPVWHRKLQHVYALILKARCVLMEHRNLCEDYLRIDSMRSEEIGMCAEIEIAQEADVNEVLAEIYYRVGDFLSPDIRFYTLKEMLDKGKTPDQIFNGPQLSHGFVEQDDLDRSVVIKEVHVSDIYNIIMDVPGVIAIKELSLVNYLNGLYQTKGQKWILPLKGDNRYAAKLSEIKSKILFYKDVLPYRASTKKVDDLLREKKARNRRRRLKGIDLDLAIPPGEDRFVEQYTSIQNDFPLTYGIGQDGIPGNPDDLREAQAKQLKAFLLFFDQLLANYLSQLAHVRDLFSMQPMSPAHTYFSQAVTDVKDVKDIYKHYASPDFSEVAAKVQEIAEPSGYEERRNRVLDHLIARFAESFAEYSLYMLTREGDVAQTELIADKERFLADYPVLSADRYRSYNYRPLLDCKTCNPNALWNTDENVSGFQRRIYRMLGINEVKTRALTCHCFSVEERTPGDPDTKFIWVLRDRDNKSKVLLHSIEYDTWESANYMITYAINMIEEDWMVEEGRLDSFRRFVKTPEQKSDYSFKCVMDAETPNGNPVTGNRFGLLNACKNVIAISNKYVKKADRDADLQKVREYVRDYCAIEGFHMLEHILVRPRFKDEDNLGLDKDPFLPICLCDKTEGVQVPPENEKPLFFELFEDVAGEWRFRIRDNQGRIILRSEGYEQLSGAQNGIKSVKTNRFKPATYQLKRAVDDRYYFNLVAPNHEIIGTSNFYETLEARQEVLEYFLCQDDGSKDEENCLDCEENRDPYSFRMSIVLPAWAGRFRDMNFRRLAEKTLRKEAPAHIALKICWIDRDQMAEYECALADWMFTLGRCDLKPQYLTPKLKALFEIMNNLKNVYPLATLHDCDESPTGSPQVVLNNTSLGAL